MLAGFHFCAQVLDCFNHRNSSVWLTQFLYVCSRMSPQGRRAGRTPVNADKGTRKAVGFDNVVEF